MATCGLYYVPDWWSVSYLINNVYMVVLFILLCLYASSSGCKDAILYGRKGADTFDWNEHMLFVFERVLVLSIALYSTLYKHSSLLDAIVLFATFACSFSFFHNGFYYETARQINRSEYRFWSNSKTSTARLEMTWGIRLALLLLSLGILIFYISIK